MSAIATYDDLVAPTNQFISSITPLVRGLAGGDHDRNGRSWKDTVVNEVSDLIAGMIDSDAVHTDAELWGLIRAIGPHLTTSLEFATPGELRRTGLVAGKRTWIERPSALFALLVDADRQHGGRRAWIYYRHALELAHAVAAIDVHTSRGELDAIARFRSMLLGRIEAAGIHRPPVEFFTGPHGEPETPGRIPIDPGTHVETPPVPGSALPTATAGVGAPAVPELPPVKPPRPVEVLLGELDKLIGLEPVKAEVKLVTDLLAVQRLRDSRGLPTVKSSRHLVFTGNPGTGKTTVARLLAEIYASLEVVSRGHLVETDRSALVAGFVGQTAAKTKEVCESAMDGVLLIDEAYALARGGPNDFGKEAIDTLVKFVEDERDRLVVIVAGYPAEMADFIAANPGLDSRFPKTIHFPDYDVDELVAIFEIITKKNHYALSEAAKHAATHWFLTLDRGHGFGNGREARNLFEASMARQASRMVTLENPTDDELVTLLGIDVLDEGGEEYDEATPHVPVEVDDSSDDDSPEADVEAADDVPGEIKVHEAPPRP